LVSFKKNKNMKTEIINEELTRVKLLMGYDTKKTLTENTESLLSEQLWKVALEDMSKVMSRDSEAALRSLEGGFREGTATWKNMVTVDGVKLTKTADVLEAVRLGKLGPSGTGEVAKTLFLRGSSLEMRTAGAEAITSMGKFGEKYAGKSREQIVERLLQDTKYTREEAELLADTYLKKGGKKIVPDPVPDPIPTPPPPIPNRPPWWDKIKNLPYKKAVKYLIGAGILYWLWQYLTSDEESPFPACLRNKLSGDDAKLIQEKGLDNALIITKTGNDDVDAAGGAIFYDNGDCESLNGRYDGKWEGEGPIIITIGSKEYIIECGGSPVPPPPPPPPTSKCKPCSSFPMEKWCKSDKIEEIQNCIGAKVDGCYGPETEGKLIDKGYPTTITKDVYDKIIKNCGGSSTDDDNSFIPNIVTGDEL